MSATSQPGTVSVVTATYKGGAFVGEALASVFSQTRPVQEVLIVDDASPDDTAEVVRTLIRKAPIPVRLLVLPSNSGGPARPQNVGVAAARGEYIVVLDQDDVLLPTHCERLVGALERNPKAALAFGPCGELGAPELPGALCQPPEILESLRQEGHRHEGQVQLDGTVLAAHLLARGNFVVGFPGFVFRRSDWEKKGGFDEGLRIAADYDALLWLALRGEAILVSEKVYLRRSHASNASSARLPSAIEVARILTRTLRQYPFLAQQPIFRRFFRHHFLWLLSTLDEAEQYVTASRFLGSAARLWGWDRVFAYHAWYLFGSWRRGPITTGAGRKKLPVREFVANLRDLLRLCRG